VFWGFQSFGGFWAHPVNYKTLDTFRSRRMHLIYLALTAVSVLGLPATGGDDFGKLESVAQSVLLNALTPLAESHWSKENANTLQEEIATRMQMFEISLPKPNTPLSKEQQTKVYKFLFTLDSNGDCQASKLCLPLHGFRVKCLPPIGLYQELRQEAIEAQTSEECPIANSACRSRQH
jgi:hypothetical protein